MDKIQIVLDKPVYEDQLLGELKAKFPVLAQAHVAILQQGKKQTLEIVSGKVDVEQIRKMILAHQGPVARINDGAEVIAVVSKSALAKIRQETSEQQGQDEMTQLLEMAKSIPGGIEVIKASMVVMSYVQEVVQGEATKILQSVADQDQRLVIQEEKMNELKISLISIREDLKNAILGISELKARQEQTEKAMSELSKKLDVFSTLWAGLKDAVTKKV